MEEATGIFGQKRLIIYFDSTDKLSLHVIFFYVEIVWKS